VIAESDISFRNWPAQARRIDRNAPALPVPLTAGRCDGQSRACARRQRDSRSARPVEAEIKIEADGLRPRPLQTDTKAALKSAREPAAPRRVQRDRAAQSGAARSRARALVGSRHAPPRVGRTARCGSKGSAAAGREASWRSPALAPSRAMAAMPLLQLPMARPRRRSRGPADVSPRTTTKLAFACCALVSRHRWTEWPRPRA